MKAPPVISANNSRPIPRCIFRSNPAQLYIGTAASEKTVRCDHAIEEARFQDGSSSNLAQVPFRGF